MLEPLDLVYICGNQFLATNSTLGPVQVTYRVVGTDETGSLTLPAGTGEDPGYSETDLETVKRGPVELYQDDQRVARRRNEGSPCGPSAVSTAALVASGPESGNWSAPFPWPVVALHLSLLPDGRVLSWGLDGTPQVWDPATGDFTAVPSPAWLFCAGHSFLPDGRLLVSGGHIATDRGIPDNTIFSAGSQSWSQSTPMRRGRWYPTNTTLASGAVVILAGRDEAGAAVAEPEVWSSGGIRVLSNAGLVLPYYPRTFLAPNGRIFYAGELQTTRYLNPSGTGSWTTVGNRLYGTRNYGSAVMYDKGKILYAGGGRTTNTAEIIDLNAASPSWRWTGSMAYPRRYHNATVLPTGEVLVTGGTSSGISHDVTKAVRAAELWNPTTGVWTTLASNGVSRTYHSTSLLLPDGRILHSGSGDASGMPDERNAELFSPPYLSRGPRPTITDAPSLVGYGVSFRVATPQAADIAKVSLIRLGSVTHAFDMNQRFEWLSFEQESEALNISAPTSRNLTPPGHYMLFILDGNGVPSEATIVKVGSVSEPPPPPNASPTAAFLVGCGNFSCTFADRSDDADGDLSDWTWDFGDGSGSSARDPTHTYDAEGEYTITLTAMDDDGATGTASKRVSVPGPEFPLGLIVTGRVDATKHYMTLTWTRAQGSTVYVYRDGLVLATTANDGGQTFSKTFQGPATYVFKVCEAGTAICSNTATLELGALPPNTPPTANFTQSCTALTCNFTDRSTDSDGSVTGWSWAFGDGGTSTGRNPSRTYATAGTYDVRLTVTDNAGATHARSAPVTVAAAGSISLTASGTKDATKHYSLLLWSGASGATVDIYMNGNFRLNTPNDGRHTVVRTFQGSATYVFKVCKAGTSICSNNATVVFQ
jgi:PKD repeat protein